MLALPRDLLLYVAGKLSLTTVCKLARTCKRWNEVAAQGADSPLAYAKRAIEAVNPEDTMWYARALLRQDAQARTGAKRHRAQPLPPAGEIVAFGKRQKKAMGRNIGNTACRRKDCGEEAVVFCASQMCRKGRCLTHVEDLYCNMCSKVMGCCGKRYSCARCGFSSCGPCTSRTDSEDGAYRLCMDCSRAVAYALT